MNYFKYDILFQEIPDEISLGIYFTGCNLKCSGCHSPELWNSKNGFPFSTELLTQWIQKYQNKISCVLFMGGDWEPDKLSLWALIVKNYQLKVALYTGKEWDDLPSNIQTQFHIIKTGPWKWELGGLNSPTTNQKLHYNKEVL